MKSVNMSLDTINFVGQIEFVVDLWFGKFPFETIQIQNFREKPVTDTQVQFLHDL